jgi:hypothetical protein
VHEHHGFTTDNCRATTMLAGIRAGGINRHRLPKRSWAFSDSDDSKI